MQPVKLHSPAIWPARLRSPRLHWKLGEKLSQMNIPLMPTQAWRGGLGGCLFSSSRLFSDISNACLPWKLQKEKNEKASHYHPSCHRLCISEKLPEHQCGRSKTRTGQSGRGSVGNGGTIKAGPQPFREKRRHDKGEKKNLRQKSDPQGQGQLSFCFFLKRWFNTNVCHKG